MQRECPGPTVSFSTLETAGLDPRRVFLTSADVAADEVLSGTGRTAYIQDTREDDWTDLERTLEENPRQAVVRGAEGRTLLDCQRPPAGMLIRSTDPLRAHWHILGAVLLRTCDGRALLATIDEGTYCVIECPAPPPLTVEAALQSLKPEAVLAAEAAGVNVLRQGEWYVSLYLCPKTRGRQSGTSLPSSGRGTERTFGSGHDREHSPGA